MGNRSIQVHSGRFALALLLALATAGAEQANAGTPAHSTAESNRASATVAFRIVIPAVLRFDAPRRVARANAPAAARSVTVHDGKQVVTLASP